MKKRILSALLVLTMMISMAPVVVTAAPVETVASPYAGTHATTGHTCEHEGCGATDWTAWPTDGTIPTSGHYYLTKNVQLNGQIGLSNKKLHICLNGYVITAKANSRLGWTYGTGELVITDCTACEENGVYYAGAMTGGKTTEANGGGGFFLYEKSLLELHDGRITNCTTTTQGGAISSRGTVKLYGGELAGNSAVSGTAAKDGGAIFNNAAGVLIAEDVRFVDNHADYGNGGVVRSWGNATFRNCTFSGNNAGTAGVLALAGSGKAVVIEGCTFTGNTAGVASTINVGTEVSVTIQDTTITENSNKNGFGAVNMVGGAKPVVLKGKVIIADNFSGTDIPNNLHVQDGATEGVDVSGLTDGTKIGVHLRGARNTFSTANTANNKNYFSSDTDGLVVVLNEDNRLALTKYIPPEHAHCVCGKAGCTDHEQLEYQKLTDASQLAAGGSFYLDSDLTLEKRVGIQNGTKLSVCLNGHSIDSNASSGPLLWTYGEARIDICDCSAKPGAISGHNNKSTTAGTFFIRAKGELNFYGGQILQCADQKGGGAIRVEPGATLNFYDGVISGCSSEGGGGAIFNSGTAYIYGGRFVGNSTKLNEEAKDGGAIFNDTTGELHVENAVFQDNAADFGSGGAIRSWGNVTIRNCIFTGNNAHTAGTIAPAGAGKTCLLEDCMITGNTASVASAVNVGSGVAVTIKNTEITGNRNENGFGAVNVVGAAKPVTLQGKVIITGNTIGEIASNNLHIQSGATDGYDVSALTEGSSIGVSLQKSRIDNEQMHFTMASEKNNKTYFTSDDPSYQVVLGSDNKLQLRYNYTHIHCVCGKTDCKDESHVKLECKPWTDGTKLPTKGCYYLETDVTVTFRAGLDATELTLCLNGHTIKAAESYEKSRAFYLRTSAKLTLTDCAAESGAIRGFRLAAIMCDSNCTDARIDLYNIAITDNHSTKTGGAVIVQNGAVFNMYSGKITGNSVASSLKEDKTYEYCHAGGVYVGSGAIFNLYGGEITGNEAKAIDKKGGLGGGLQVAYGATANLYAGKISGNKAYNGGGILVIGKDAVLNLRGTEIFGNTANNGGGILSQSGATVNMSAGKLWGNKTSANGGGLYVSSNTTFNLTGGAITGNQAAFGGGIYTLSAVSTFSGGSIEGNEATKGGGGVYISMANSVGPSTAYLKGSVRISNNTAGTTGGGIGVSGKGTKLYMTGGTVTGNKGQNGGGVIVFTDSVLELSGGTISRNNTSAAGGGVYISIGGTICMTGGTIEENHAGTNGGAIVHYRSTGTYTGGAIRGNTCDGNGAVFMLTGAASNIYVKGFEFTGGNGKNGSVACNSGGSTVNFEDCKFYKNVSDSAHGTVYVSSNSFGSFKNCKFYNNEVAYDGGAIFGGPNCKIDLWDCVFTENISGRDGGAILCRGTVTCENCDISNNQAAGRGGGIATAKCGITGSKIQKGLVLKNTTVANNTAAEKGGGLYLSIGCRATITDTVVSGNSSGTEGSGFWAVDDTTFHNVTITGNVSKNNGYAAWYDASIYDGQSYFVGVHKLSGDMIITDNQGGDVFLGEKTAVSVGKDGLGEKTRFNITLDSGVLTSRLHGEYNYEGGNQVYTVTYGSRSLTEIENVASVLAEDQTQQAQIGDILLYVGIGIVALAALAAAVLLIRKKTKTK